MKFKQIMSLIAITCSPGALSAQSSIVKKITADAESSNKKNFIQTALANG